MYQVYKISESQLPDAARRIIVKVLPYLLGTYILFIIYLFVILSGSLKIVLLSMAVCVPALGLALLIGYFSLKSTYRSFRIALDDEGVTFAIRGNDKKIRWKNIQMLTQSANVIILRDKKISPVMRFLTGKGSIQLIPEIEHYDRLLEEIKSRQEPAETNTESTGCTSINR